MNLGSNNLQVPRSVYIHVPFCRHRCGYCNFTLVAGRDYLADRYLNAIEMEIQTAMQQRPSGSRPSLDTLYLGGGTPSHLSSVQLLRLRRILDQQFDINGKTEFTVECNPSDIDAEKVGALAEIGVNRISLGVQSFHDFKLKQLERDHDHSVVQNAMELLQTFCDNVSIDLIFATDGESLQSWQQDLQHAVELSPQHLSTYELTYEKGTSFWNRMKRSELLPLDDELRSEMYAATIACLTQNRFEHYEVSSFAKPNKRSMHNQVYWSGKPFFAFGPGASRFLGSVRQTNFRSTTRYLKAIESGESPVAEVDELSQRQRAREMLSIGLRQREGVDVKAFTKMHSVSPVELAGPFMERFSEYHFVDAGETYFRLTEKGLFVADWIAEQILTDS